MKGIGRSCWGGACLVAVSFLWMSRADAWGALAIGAPSDRSQAITTSVVGKPTEDEARKAALESVSLREEWIRRGAIGLRRGRHLSEPVFCFCWGKLGTCGNRTGCTGASRRELLRPSVHSKFRLRRPEQQADDAIEAQQSPTCVGRAISVHCRCLPVRESSSCDQPRRPVVEMRGASEFVGQTALDHLRAETLM